MEVVFVPRITKLNKSDNNLNKNTIQCNIYEAINFGAFISFRPYGSSSEGIL
jgi:hypothetical protein